MPAALGRNGGSTAQRLRHEALALRLVSLTTRHALEDLDRLAPSSTRDTWARQLALWIDGVLVFHRGRIGLLRGQAVGPETVDELASLEKALLDVEAVAQAARDRNLPG